MINPREKMKAPSRRDVLQFCWVFLAGFAVIGGLVYLKRPELAVRIWIAAAAVSAASFAVPPFGRLAYRAWMGLGLVIGFFTSKIVMLVIFYGVFTPVALVFRLMGRDALERRRRPEAATCWHDLPEPAPDDHDHLY